MITRLLVLLIYLGIGAMLHAVFVGPVLDWGSAWTWGWLLGWPLMALAALFVVSTGVMVVTLLLAAFGVIRLEKP